MTKCIQTPYPKETCYILLSYDRKINSGEDKNLSVLTDVLCNPNTLEYLIAEQDGIREQDGILSQEVKEAGWNITR